MLSSLWDGIVKRIIIHPGEFGGTDYIFFGGYFIIVLAIGFWVGRKEKTTISEYFRAANTLPWYAIGFSIIAAGISSEQFVGEMGLAYALGMPVVNWDWLIFPAISILLWIFIPIYVRGRITTMPEYLERRFGPRARTLYAGLIVASYVFANFALVFYTAGIAMEFLWGVNRLFAIWVLAITTGAYTIYGGLKSVAWTDVFQCVLLLGGGIYVFFAGMNYIGWDFAGMISGPKGSPVQYAHLFNPSTKADVPWTALIILALSTNTWYYATDQFINQRCLGAKNEWHAKMGVLLAAGIQLLMPLATCFPGMIYRVIEVKDKIPMADRLTDINLAYPSVVKTVIPMGLRGLVVAAVIGAIMSTISGLVNSTSTMVSLDILQRWKGRNWSEMKVVRSGQWVGVIALLLGASMAGVVMNWDSMFLYCQEIWAPMAAPAVVVFLAGAFWKPARSRGAIACLWMSILTVPITFGLKYIAEFTNIRAGEESLTAGQLAYHAKYLLIWSDKVLPIVAGVVIVGFLCLLRTRKSGTFALALGLPALYVSLILRVASAMQAGGHVLPTNLQNAMVWAGGVYLMAIIAMLALTLIDSLLVASVVTVFLSLNVAAMTLLSAPLVALNVLLSVLGAIFYYCWTARKASADMWDRSMLGLPKGEVQRWYSSLWGWWLVVGAVFVGLYVYFW